MVAVGAPKKELTERMRARLEAAVAARSIADAALWEACADAILEGTYEEVAAVAGVAKSTLQEKIRVARSGR